MAEMPKQIPSVGSRFTDAVATRLLKDLVMLVSTHLVNVIWKILYPAMKEANRVRLCLPEPPTPTNRAWPRSVRMIREILAERSIYSLVKFKLKNIVLDSGSLGNNIVMSYCHQQCRNGPLKGQSEFSDHLVPTPLKILAIPTAAMQVSIGRKNNTDRRSITRKASSSVAKTLKLLKYTLS